MIQAFHYLLDIPNGIDAAHIDYSGGCEEDSFKRLTAIEDIPRWIKDAEKPIKILQQFGFSFNNSNDLKPQFDIIKAKMLAAIEK